MVFRDSDIIEAIVNNTDAKDKAIMYLYKVHYQLIERFVLANSGNKENAADVFQDTLIVFYKSVTEEEYNSRSTLKTYLLGVAKNVWFNKLRKKKLARLNELRSSTESFYMQKMLTEEGRVSVDLILEQLGSPCKDLLIDFYFHKMPVKALMKKYNLGSEAATKNKKYRCMERLIKLVKDRNFKRDDFEMP